jgi:tRNA(Ile)-lysidine synthase
LTGGPAPAQSIEAWARHGRHSALQEMAVAAGADLLLLAHHRRDQAETFVLQALRGAGAAGLAAMPATQWRDGVCWARPWLQQPREAIEAYVAQHQLSHIEDDSNTNQRFSRNRLRLGVWPALAQAFPEAEASLARAASWAQQALDLQREVAAEDLQRCSDALPGLKLAAVQALSKARASNVLRAWLHAQCGRPAPASLIERLQREWGAVDGQWPCADGLLRLYRGRLRWLAPIAAARLLPSQLVNLASVGVHAQADWGGNWWVEAVSSGGVSLDRLRALTLRARTGAEQFQRTARSTVRSLKKAYQSAAIPAWQRDGPLLFFSEHQLLFAPGLGLDARLLAEPDEAQFKLSWLPQA